MEAFFQGLAGPGVGVAVASFVPKQIPIDELTIAASTEPKSKGGRHD
jgi:hypothetical protein